MAQGLVVISANPSVTTRDDGKNVFVHLWQLLVMDRNQLFHLAGSQGRPRKCPASTQPATG